MAKITPAKKIVVVTPKEVKRGKTIVFNSEKAQETGEVVAIGKGKLPLEGLKVGDIIAYRRFGEAEYYVDGRSHYFIDFKDILGLIEEGGDNE